MGWMSLGTVASFSYKGRQQAILQSLPRPLPKGEAGGGHTVSHPVYLHGPLQMFGPENGVWRGSH